LRAENVQEFRRRDRDKQPGQQRSDIDSILLGQPEHQNAQYND
jgi:hypothetical protein